MRSRCRCCVPAQELSDWRVRINGQVKSYQAEMGGLRSKLSSEMEALKQEFLDLRSSLQQQMEATWLAVGTAEGEEAVAVKEAPAAAPAEGARAPVEEP